MIMVTKESGQTFQIRGIRAGNTSEGIRSALQAHSLDISATALFHWSKRAHKAPHNDNVKTTSSVTPLSPDASRYDHIVTDEIQPKSPGSYQVSSVCNQTQNASIDTYSSATKFLDSDSETAHRNTQVKDTCDDSQDDVAGSQQEEASVLGLQLAAKQAPSCSVLDITMADFSATAHKLIKVCLQTYLCLFVC
jgi:hypothetical protein